MNNRDQRRYQRLTRVRIFGRERAADFPPGSKAAELLAAIDQQLIELDGARLGQVPELIDKLPLLKALSLYCKKIARTAKAIDLHTPGFAAPYLMPEKPGEQPLLTHADGLLQRLDDQPDDSAEELGNKAALRARFHPYALATNFVQELRQHREALRAAHEANQSETQDGVGNTKLIEERLDTAGHTVQELDAIVVNKFGNEPDQLRAWRTASRIESAPRRAKKVVGDAERSV